MYSNVVLGLDGDILEHILEQMKEKRSVTRRYGADRRRPQGPGRPVQAQGQGGAGTRFPLDPQEQLWGAIGAVFGSWMNARAITYRRLNEIPAEWGTAVNVQSMVFGNMGDDCATGVAFTRDPATGEN